jgi:Rho guanine nucleotide exchange factor 12
MTFLCSGLQEDLDKETVLRKLFWKARAKARKNLKEQLSEFCEKRVAGLGSLFGPPDHVPML